MNSMLLQYFYRYGTLLAILTGLSFFSWPAQAQQIQCPPDLYLDCDDAVPAPDPSSIMVGAPACGNYDDCCTNRPLTDADGCSVKRNECFQVALVCIRYNHQQYPVFRFKVYNACNKDLSNITFSLPRLTGEEGSWYPATTPSSGPYETCDKRFQVERPSGGPDAGTLKFEGKLQPGKSACFEYVLHHRQIPDIITVKPKLGQQEFTIEIPTRYCYNLPNPQVTFVEDQVSGNTCSGKVINRVYKVTYPGSPSLSPIYCTQKIYIAKDDMPPTGSCPPGLTGLQNINQVPPPDPSGVAARYSDNCSGPVKAEMVNRTVTGGDCGAFSVTYKYRIYDKCNNSTYCEVTHRGGSGSGSITGSCPPDKNNLQCMAQVPDPNPSAVASRFTGADGGPVTVKLIQSSSTGNDCAGFEVKHKYEIKDNCGNKIYCTVTFKGKDTTPPTGTCPSGVSGLTSTSAAPAPDPNGVARHYTDNCGKPVEVQYIGKTTTTGNCGAFAITYKYKVSDKCGKYTWCEVTHTGSTGSGQITGNCPTGDDDLQCLSQVPDPNPSAVARRYTGADGGPVTVKLIENKRTGDECSGFEVKHRYEVKDNCGNKIYCTVIFKGKDTTPPTGTCPSGVSGLTSTSAAPAPDPNGVARHYTDNCGKPVEAWYIGKTTTTGNCGAFAITYKYKINDQCGNYVWCEVTHTGNTGSGQITGNCPNGRNDLTCLSEVPNPDPARLAQLFTGADGGPVTAKVVENKRTGDNCSGFWVKHTYEIKDNCGNTRLCTVMYEGKDNKAPQYTFIPQDKVIGCDDDIIFDPPQATDNCGQATIRKVGQDMIIEGPCPESYSVVRTWIAVDACDNYAYPVSQTITIPEDCCPPQICTYTTGYWSKHIASGEPNVFDLLESGNEKLPVGPWQLDTSCIDVLLPGHPIANAQNLDEFCPDDIVSNALIRQTIALKLNLLLNPSLCEVLLTQMPCPVDPAIIGLEDDATVCDLVVLADLALTEAFLDCELSDAIATVNECYDCLICEPAPGNDHNSALSQRSETKPLFSQPIQPQDLNPDQDVEVFPNPSNGPVQVRLNGFKGQRSILAIHHLVGGTVYQTIIPEDQDVDLKIDLSRFNLTDGLYIITVSSGQKTTSRKLTISKAAMAR